MRQLLIAELKIDCNEAIKVTTERRPESSLLQPPNEEHKELMHSTQGQIEQGRNNNSKLVSYSNVSKSYNSKTNDFKHTE